MKNNPLSSYHEFKPALRFLLVFVGIYVSANVIYGIYVEAFKPLPDPFTHWVTTQSTSLISFFSEPVESKISTQGPYILVLKNNRNILSVFEGCNGLNVMIVFASFVIAFGGGKKNVVLFVFYGCCLLHFANLVRLMLLYHMAVYKPALFYYFHKYFFTAILYLVVLGLWYFWIERARGKLKQESDPVKT